MQSKIKQISDELSADKQVLKEFFTTKLKKNRITIEDDNDEILDRISSIFIDERIGTNLFADQEQYDAFVENADKRIEEKLPPAFKDKIKDNDENSSFFCQGIDIKNSYGDLIIFKEIINYAKQSPDINCIVFISNDGKEDWKQLLPQDRGPKLDLGPRYELKQEVYKEAPNINNFYIFKSNEFLKFSSIASGEDIDGRILDIVENVEQQNKDMDKYSSNQKRHVNEYLTKNNKILDDNKIYYKNIYNHQPDYILDTIDESNFSKEEAFTEIQALYKTLEKLEFELKDTYEAISLMRKTRNQLIHNDNTLSLEDKNFLSRYRNLQSKQAFLEEEKYICLSRINQLQEFMMNPH